MANTAGNAVSLAGDVPVSSFSTAWRLSAQLMGSFARTSVIWFNHLTRIFAPVYRMPLKAFRPVSMRPFDNLKQRAWALAVKKGKHRHPSPPTSVVSPSTAPLTARSDQLYQRIGAFRAMRTVYAAEGFLSLLHHLSPALLANVVLGSLMFTSYEAAVQAEHAAIDRYPDSWAAWLFTPRHQPTSISSASLVLAPVSYPGICLAGAFSGLTQSLLVTPMQAVNTHYEHHHYLHTMQSRNPNDPAYSYSGQLRPSHHDSFRRIYRREGLRGLFRGLSLTCVRDTIGMGLFFGTFQAVKSVLVRPERFDAPTSSGKAAQAGAEEEAFLKRELGWSDVHVWNSVSIVLAGVCSGFAYRLFTHPFMVLQHRRDRDYVSTSTHALTRRHSPPSQALT